MSTGWGYKSSIFLEYGMGIVAYFQLIRDFLKLFGVLTLLSSIQMILYYNVGGYQNIADQVDFYAMTSFGNMGFSSIQCNKQLVDWDNDDQIRLSLSCEHTTMISDVHDSGVLLSHTLPGGKANVAATCSTEALPEGFSKRVNE